MIKTFDQRFILIDDWIHPMVLTRAWCVWEILGVSNQNLDLKFIYTAETQESLKKMLSGRECDLFTGPFSTLNLDSLGCDSPDDLRRIKAAISLGNGTGEGQESLEKRIRLSYDRALVSVIETFLKNEYGKKEASQEENIGFKNNSGPFFLLNVGNVLLAGAVHELDEKDKIAGALLLSRAALKLASENEGYCYSRVGQLYFKQGGENDIFRAGETLKNAINLLENNQYFEDSNHELILAKGYELLAREAARDKIKRTNDTNEDFYKELTDIVRTVKEMIALPRASHALEELFEKLVEKLKSSPKPKVLDAKETRPSKTKKLDGKEKGDSITEVPDI